MSRSSHAPWQDLHASHGLTYVSLACGVWALAAASQPAGGHLAGAALALAALADTFDGRFARRFPRTARQAAIGGAIDSLVDACVFGVVPVAVLAMQAPPAPGFEALVWWAAAFAYALAAVTRLAHFDVEGNPAGFVGVPTPAVALVWSSVLLSMPPPTSVALILLATGAGMVAPITIPRPRPAVLALFAGWAATLVVAHLVD